MNSYSELDDAYNTVSDLLQSQTNCVYDNIVNDDNNIMENYHQMNMFTTQGDFKSFEDVDNIYGSFNTKEDLPFSVEKKQTLLKQKGDEKPTEISSLDEIKEKKIEKIEKKELIEKPKEKEINLSKDEEKQIKTIVQESFKNMMNINRISPKKIEAQNDVLLSEIRDIVLIVLIGILVIILLDLLVRIARKI